jgi:asparagine synthase (glutamine-hydrolysing)
MCGIAGFFGLGLGETAARQMCERIRHRGPDGGGITVRDGVALGMARLAIVDVERGKQPMLSDDEQIALVYNGEIYNAPELRRQLECEGVRFRTRSDTEVILRLYERNPARVEEALVGMWAFAIHDRRRNRLILSRDRFGIKPLYVADGGDALAFGSEMRAFEPVRNERPLARLFSIDHGAAHAMLAWAYIPNEDSIFVGVKKVPPATRIEIDLLSRRRETRRYWELGTDEAAARVSSLDEACELIECLLRRAVREHLESDVPIAAFLSGGIDSSLVLKYAVEASSRPIEAYTIGFREPRFDESAYAREVAARLGVTLHVEVFDESMARSSLDEAMAAYDEPFGDSSSLATFLLSKIVARGHKVALGGDGGDEAFAGYKKHRIIPFRETLRHTPRIRTWAARALRALPSRTDRSTAYSDALRVLQRAARALEGDDGAAYLALTQVASLAKTAPLVRHPADPERFEVPILRAFAEAGGSQLRRTLTCDIQNPLPNDMLLKVDRASMACSLEARVPFLDHRLVEAGISLPADYTLSQGGKLVTKRLFARAFGSALAGRKKTGFGVPVETWMRGPLSRRCAEVFTHPVLAATDVLSDQLPLAWPEWRERDCQILWHAFVLAAWLARNTPVESLANTSGRTSKGGCAEPVLNGDD